MIYAFSNIALDIERRELRRDGAAMPIEPQVFDLLVCLIERRDRVVTRQELLRVVWGGRIVSDAALSSRVKAARAAIGDDGARQALIKTLHGRGFRFVGALAEPQPRPEPAERAPLAGAPGAELRQDIRYRRSFDGARIAYALSGAGPMLVKTANWMSHLEYELESPVWRHWIAGLSAESRLLRYDERGNGLSERAVSDLSFEAMVRDLEHVVDAAAPPRFALLGVSHGCAIAIEYAARHPERVSHLVLFGGYAKGWLAHGDPVEVSTVMAVNSLIRVGWGQDNPAFRQIFTSLFMPEASPELAARYNALQQRSVSAEVAAAMHRTCINIDVVSRLRDVAATTLVLHARDDAVVPVDAGRALAALIPDARLVTLESRNHVLLEQEPAFQRFIDEVRRFIR